MTYSEIAAWLGAAGFLVFALGLALNGWTARAGAWKWPAGLSLAFLAWSLGAAWMEGPLGFWPEHTRHAWGNQIWFDLLLAAGVALAFLVPQARSLGMRPLPWVLAVACTGSIGLLAMTARVLYLKEKQA